VEKKKTAVYIDGYNLYYGRLRGTAFKWLDLPVLFDKLLAIQEPAATLEAVKFFSARRWPALRRMAKPPPKPRTATTARCKCATQSASRLRWAITAWIRTAH
jgi:hypothetical protein